MVSAAIQVAGRLLSPVGSDELFALIFVKVCAFLTLLALYHYLYRQLRTRMLRLWIAGWVILTLCAIGEMTAPVQGASLVWAAIEGLSFVAFACFLASSIEFNRSGRRSKAVWFSVAVGALAVGVISLASANSGYAAAWIPNLIDGILLLLAGWGFLKSRLPRGSNGASLLGTTLVLFALDVLNRAAWIAQPISRVHAATSSLLQIGAGLGMVVLAMDISRNRIEDLNAKLQRLTLITAASTQSLDVPTVVNSVLKQLVESLGASHGILRMVAGAGEKSELVIESAIGFSEEYLRSQRAIPASDASMAALLEQRKPYIVLDDSASDALRAHMDQERLSVIVLVRLPGENAPLGVLGVGSAERRDFQPDEISFLVTAGNLLGLTIENVRLVEHASTAESHWSNTFDSIADPVFVHDPEGKILRANHALAARLQRTPESLAGVALASVFGSTGPRSWRTCPYCEAPSGHSEVPDQILGGIFLASSSEFEDKSGRRTGFSHVLRDITAWKNAEAKYRTLIENLQEGVFISTLTGRFEDFNEAFQRMLGYEKRDELLAVKDIAAAIYVNPADRERLKRLLAQHGSVSDFEFQMRRRDGEILTVLESSIVRKDSTGKICGVQGFVLDITERKRAEQEIRRRNRELIALNTIGQTLNQPEEIDELSGRVLRQVVELFGADAGSVFLFENDSNLLKRVAAAGLKSSYSEEFPAVEFPRDLSEHLQAVQATVMPLGALPLPATFKDFQQREEFKVGVLAFLWTKERMAGCILLASREVREFSSAEMNLLGSIANQVATSIDRIRLLRETQTAYDDLRRTQEQLLQSEKMAAIGQLISGVAHELNNPLTAILGYSQLLATGDMVNERGAEYVDKVHKQARRTHRIVNNLLSFARQQRPQRSPVRINQAIEDILALREYDLRINNIRIHRDYADPLPMVSADTHQLQQVFLNIINNSVDAILERSDRGEIWVRTSQSEDSVSIEFTDSGPGVKDAHRVFDPFYTTKPVGKGTGLGLSICYGIVSEHGGDIQVENDPDRGARFTITLPVPAAVEPTGAAADGDSTTIRGRVLLVDDEEAVLGLEKEILESRALSVTAVRTGEEAMNLLSAENVDLIVTDMKMPGQVSGIALYEWVQQNRPDLARRVVFTMSDAANDTASSALRDSGVTCVQKPFEVETFWGVIQRTLREAETADVKP